jgi:hypothetical protein
MGDPRIKSTGDAMALRNVLKNTSSRATKAGKVAYVAVSGLDFAAALATGLTPNGSHSN